MEVTFVVCRDNSYLTDIQLLAARLQGAACRGFRSYFLWNHRCALSSVNTASARFPAVRVTATYSGQPKLFRGMSTVAFENTNARRGRYANAGRSARVLSRWRAHLHPLDVSSVPFNRRPCRRSMRPLDADKSLQRRLNSRTRERRSIQRALVHRSISLSLSLSFSLFLFLSPSAPSHARVLLSRSRWNNGNVYRGFIAPAVSSSPSDFRRETLTRRDQFARRGKLISHVRKNQPAPIRRCAVIGCSASRRIDSETRTLLFQRSYSFCIWLKRATMGS